MRMDQENEDSAQLSNCSSGRMDKTIEAGATDAQLETLGELLLLEAKYLQDCVITNLIDVFGGQLFFIPFP